MCIRDRRTEASASSVSAFNNNYMTQTLMFFGFKPRLNKLKDSSDFVNCVSNVIAMLCRR